MQPITITTALVLCAAGPAARAAEPASRPNVLLILVDDMGFSDLGCFGSEIETPQLDQLAAGGLRLTQFYNTAKCHSSRISLLTGRYAYQAGNQQLSRATTVAETLRQAGYFTAMTGKWHLKEQPTDFGFDRYFGHLSGATNYYLGDNTFRLNGQPWKPPQEGFYTTIANVDYAIRFLDEARAEKKPWLMYVAFNAPHAPIQPLEQDYRKYLGRYDAGWEVIRAARVQRQKDLGLFDADQQPCPRPDHLPAWDALPPERQAAERRHMAGYAGLIDRIDQEVGRLIGDLRRHNELDNTLVMFFSDNGACPFGRTGVTPEEPYLPTTRWGDSTGWAWVRNSPFRLYKQNQHEGGVTSPAIVHWPAGLKTKPGAIVAAPAHLVDVLPTVADIVGADLPTAWPGRELSSVSGTSLKPIFEGGALTERTPIHLQFGPNRGLREGDWKVVSFKGNPWELYNMADDRTELHDLASSRPDVRDRLAALWHEMAAGDLQVPERSRAPVRQNAAPVTDEGWSDYGTEVQPRRKKARRQEADPPAATPQSSSDEPAARPSGRSN